MYHNTTGIAGSDLAMATEATLSQDARIFKSFREGIELSADDLYKRFQESILLTSIRRSLDTLKKEGKIYQAGQKTGRYGRPVFTYKLV